MVGNVAEKGFSQLKGRRNNPLLAALSAQRDEQVLHVHVTDAQREGFTDAAAGVQQQEQEQMQPPLAEILWSRLPADKQLDLRGGKRGQHTLRFFQIRNAQVLTSGSAFFLGARTAPMNVAVPVVVESRDHERIPLGVYALCPEDELRVVSKPN